MYFRGVVRGKPSNSAGFAEKMAAFRFFHGFSLEIHFARQSFRSAR